MHEARMWPRNVFVTLTYADEFLPPGGSLSLRDVQLFMKRLRKLKEPARVRFFLAGEYGDANKRPHYHALLFNCGFDGLRRIGVNPRGEPLYCSDELSAVWSVDGRPMGHASIGEVTLDSAVYCAKYALKKVNGDAAEDHYTVYDSDGELHVRRPEFAVMSRRPGIGASYYEKYGQEILDHDNVILGGREARPAMFYDVKSQLLAGHDDDAAVMCLCALCKNKRARKRMAVFQKADNTPERLAVKGKLMEIAVEKKERSL